MEPHECDEVVDVGDRHGARGELRGRVVDVGAVLEVMNTHSESWFFGLGKCMDRISP